MLFLIHAGVPQGSVLGPLLYILYTADVPEEEDTLLATFADDTAIISSYENYTIATEKLQKAVDKIAEWATKWKIKLNANKTIRVDFSLRPCEYVTTQMGNDLIQQANSSCYLGVHLDSKLTWKIHIQKKRDQLKLRLRQMFWMLRSRSHISIENKRLLYISILRPIWEYATPLWGSAADSNIEIIQRFQNNVLRKITGAPWYVSNHQLHNDLQVETES